MNKVVLCLSALLSTAFCSYATTISLPATADTSISARDADHNSGAHTHVSAGRDGPKFGGGFNRRGLFQFNLSAIPPGSTINAVTLNLTVVIDPSFGDVNSNFELHLMTSGWMEGTKTGNNGATASLGEATWNNRAHGFPVPWSGGTGGDGDYSISASASTAVTSVGSYSWSSTQLVADVQGWLNTSIPNNGWILISDNEVNDKTARAFGSREHGTASNRPELVVDYTPPVLPTDIAVHAPVVSNSMLELTWSGPTNPLYDVQFTRSLTGSNGWQTGEAYMEADPSGTNQWADVHLLASPVYEGNSNIFYRVAALETNITPLEIKLDPVASGLTAPLLVTHAGDGSGRLFIVEQVGRIRIVQGGSLLPIPFLDVSASMVSINTGYDERGLLGLAFHPDYKNNGRFFVHYSAPKTGSENNKTTLAEYSVSVGNSNIANAAGTILLQEPQPEGNHAGGTLAFGPDDFLYLAIGDGGGANDNHGVIGNGQNRTNLLGSIIRIDIDSAFPYAIPTNNPYANSPTLRKEIYAYGLRNPYQMSFDRGGSNELFCGDVGQNLWEEINMIENGGNYGWRITEGNHAFDLPLAGTVGVDIGNLKYPIHNYKHGPLGTTVIGGFVYRGNTYPDLVGKYVFGDFSTSFGSPDGQLYYLSETRPGLWQRFEFSIQPGGGSLNRYIKGFGEDEDGEIYLLSDTTFAPSGSNGTVHKLIKP